MIFGVQTCLGVVPQVRLKAEGLDDGQQRLDQVDGRPGAQHVLCDVPPPLAQHVVDRADAICKAEGSGSILAHTLTLLRCASAWTKHVLRCIPPPLAQHVVDRADAVCKPEHANIENRCCRLHSIPKAVVAPAACQARCRLR